MVRRVLLTLLALATVLSAVVVGRVVWAADAPKPDRLSDQVKQLMVRVSKLEARIAELESQPRRRVVPRPTPTVPPGIPKGSVPKQFNGIPYYIVPVETSKARD